ncbi:chaplin [Streptomyces sp. NPDC006339]|uniref:chaplin n=1 Tax=Streptomyces sp. NPDC006339 TaxID=3156755 RepID=UPI0033A1CD5A
MRMRMISTAALALGLALGGAGTAAAAPEPNDDGATAVGVAVSSPGVLSGNVIQVPLDLDANVCGNSINVIGILNPAFAVVCVNDGTP